MVDRLNQELNIDDLVLTRHPKTSALLRCIVVKINPKTIVVDALPANDFENETSQFNQNNMVGIGDSEFHGNYWRSTSGFQRRSEEVVKIGHLNKPDNNENKRFIADVNIGDDKLWSIL